MNKFGRQFNGSGQSVDNLHAVQWHIHINESSKEGCATIVFPWHDLQQAVNGYHWIILNQLR